MQMVCCSHPCTAWPFCRAVRSGSCALPKHPALMEIQKGAVLLVRICNAFPHVSPCVSLSARLTRVGPRTRWCCRVPEPRSAVPSPLRSQHFSLTVSWGSTSAAFPKLGSGEAGVCCVWRRCSRTGIGHASHLLPGRRPRTGHRRGACSLP